MIHKHLMGRIDAEAKAPVVWPPDVETDSLQKTDAEKD